mmetsp:Transcript_21791/g.49605  ORF Transcript_21791/g.49605 Transcript_21791/m.49605 type:complete len:198 (-) Transcript_21791:209-802(-)
MATARAGRLNENRRIGKRWEDVVASARRSSSVEVVREVYVIPLNADGEPLTKSTGAPLKTRIDIVKRRRGSTRLLECKNGPSAPLTVNQRQAFPAIEKNGYILQSGRLGLQKGTVCPPTKVEVIRPENGVVWNPECWGAQLDNAIDTHDAGDDDILWDFDGLPANPETHCYSSNNAQHLAALGNWSNTRKSWSCLHQ